MTSRFYTVRPCNGCQDSSRLVAEIGEYCLKSSSCHGMADSETSTIQGHEPDITNLARDQAKNRCDVGVSAVPKTEFPLCERPASSDEQLMFLK